MQVFQKHTKLKKQLFLSMVTIFKLKETMYSEEIVRKQVTLEDLFKEM
ncbi:MAG: family ATPase [Chlamydiota bacterium]|nr:family ATPase [Chlamydiota bacterium]